MQWLKIRVSTPEAELENLLGVLSAAGYDNVEIEDGTEARRVFYQDNSALWDYVAPEVLQEAGTLVVFYLSDTAEGQVAAEAIIRHLRELQPAWLPLLTTVREEDWADNWKNFFQPLPVGEKILIWPQWLESEPPIGKVLYRTDNAGIFGTGQHITTRLCLAELEKNLRPGQEVLDIGCGSGILFLTALKLGASRAEAVELDPASSQLVPLNAALNGVSDELYTLHCGDMLTDAGLGQKLGTYDIILANITADVIIKLLPRLRSLLPPGGLVIASGIIEERSASVQEAAAAAGFTGAGVSAAEGWQAVCLRPTSAGKSPQRLVSDRQAPDNRGTA
jgi:ribosomal protein L11 methyltransferase